MLRFRLSVGLAGFGFMVLGKRLLKPVLRCISWSVDGADDDDSSAMKLLVIYD